MHGRAGDRPCAGRRPGIGGFRKPASISGFARSGSSWPRSKEKDLGRHYFREEWLVDRLFGEFNRPDPGVDLRASASS